MAQRTGPVNITEEQLGPAHLGLRSRIFVCFSSPFSAACVFFWAGGTEKLV